MVAKEIEEDSLVERMEEEKSVTSAKRRCGGGEEWCNGDDAEEVL